MIEYFKSPLRQRLAILVCKLLDIADALIFILSFTMLYSYFNLYFMKWLNDRRMNKKTRTGREYRRKP